MPESKRQAELDYWIGLSSSLTTHCRTAQERSDALLAVAWEKAFPRYMQRLRAASSSFAGRRLLDVGCGPHAGLIGFTQCEKFGVDHLAHDYARIGYPMHLHGIGYATAKVEAMPFPAGTFDTVTCVNALDHLDDVSRSLREIGRVLKKGGRLVGQFNFHDAPTATEPHCLNHDDLERAARAAGLRVATRAFDFHLAEAGEDRYFYELVKV